MKSRLVAHNWREYQNYSKRRPPWIKLHAKTLDEPKIMTLDLASIGLLVLSWLLCARDSTNGSFDVDLDAISFTLRRPITLRDFKPLIDKGLFELQEGNASECLRVLASESVPLSLILETETETEHKETWSKDDGFDVFWEHYPKRVGKGDAIKAWNKIKPDQATQGAILIGIDRWRDSEDWTKEGRKFCPYPATWLRAARWDDDPPSKAGFATAQDAREAGIAITDGEFAGEVPF